ncbi:MAG: hypothetical protein IPM53_28430 [Anaerolineaceae bacterium]|nr:hypothetical protein [Anaerolineaceae bacterium]
MPFVRITLAKHCILRAGARHILGCLDGGDFEKGTAVTQATAVPQQPWHKE